MPVTEWLIETARKAVDEYSKGVDMDQMRHYVLDPGRGSTPALVNNMEDGLDIARRLSSNLNRPVAIVSGKPNEAWDSERILVWGDAVYVLSDEYPLPSNDHSG